MPDATAIERAGGLPETVPATMRPPCPRCGTGLEPSSWEWWYTDWQTTKTVATACGACGWSGLVPFTPGEKR